MCRLVFAKENSYAYLPNDKLAFILNLFIDKVALKLEPSFYRKHPNVSWQSIAETWILEIGNVMESFISRWEIFDAINERITESQVFLWEKGSVSLRTFKVFRFFRNNWKRIKGISVKRSAFGLWVTRKKISKLIEINDMVTVNELEEVLVYQKESN